MHSGRWRIGRWRLAAIAVVFAVLGPSTPSPEYGDVSSVPGPAVSAQTLVVQDRRDVGRRLSGMLRADRSRAAPPSVTPETSTSVASAPSRAREYSAEGSRPEVEGRWTRAEVKRVIRQAALRWGLSAEKMLRVAECESGLNPRAQSPSGKYVGLYQFERASWETRARWAGYEGRPWWDPVANANTAGWLVTEGGGWGHWTCR